MPDASRAKPLKRERRLDATGVLSPCVFCVRVRSGDAREQQAVSQASLLLHRAEPTAHCCSPAAPRVSQYSGTCRNAVATLRRTLTCSICVANVEQCVVLVHRLEGRTRIPELVPRKRRTDAARACRGHQPEVRRAGVERDAEAHVAERDDGIIGPVPASARNPRCKRQPHVLLVLG